MGIGVSNEYLAYQIINSVRREISKNNTSISQTIVNNYGLGTNITPTEVKKNIKVDQIFSALNSDNFTLKLMYEDTLNPKFLTSVIMVFDENLKQVINLIRSGKKLSQVKSSILLLTSDANSINNPLGMVTSDFLKYLMNKRAWSYYDQQVQDLVNHPEHYPDLSPANITDMVTQLNLKKEQMAILNAELRSTYAIQADTSTYDDLIHYAPNPVGMAEEDFVIYVLNKHIYGAVHLLLRTNLSNNGATVRGRLDLSLPESSVVHWKKLLNNAAIDGIFIINVGGTMDFGNGDTVDFIEGDVFILNKTVTGTPTSADLDSITDPDSINYVKIIDTAIYDNKVLRLKYSLMTYDVNDANSNSIYFEFEDLFPYADRVELDGTTTKGLVSYLPNPLGMQTYDLKKYIEYKKTLETLDASDPSFDSLNEQITQMQGKYYIDSDPYTWQELEAFIADTTIQELLLFKIIISLNYIAGKLDNVSSEVSLI